MMAITIMQPWAQLIALGAKQYETRSWYTNYRGPIAIHSSLEFPYSAQVLCKCEPFASALLGSVDLPVGCIVAIAELEGITATSQDGMLLAPPRDWSEKEEFFGDFSPGRYAWRLKNARALEKPVLAPGRQGLWKWDQGSLGLVENRSNQTPRPKTGRSK